ncbi:DUF2442 domain-containing protein [Halomonas sp. TRM85114]|uniref:DUF2442 domain-containing protein n=1 Tax=Halomonas jincaotanensis TaxID=2810616 RepID=UPI001BD6228F|nr:DUF2442 domain-containing protein [Halomonas jincaotanensis]MBS9405626.1 DUF2442 domain-containing protein [Halomonas jincaotanensis]
MTSSADSANEPLANSVFLTADKLNVILDDGRELSVPISWYPRLEHGTKDERENWELIGSGHGIHWPDLDEDICVSGLLAGKPSNESAESISKLLSNRRITKS